MYYFEAHYVDMDNDAELTKKIVFDGQFFCNEKRMLYVCYVKSV